MKPFRQIYLIIFMMSSIQTFCQDVSIDSPGGLGMTLDVTPLYGLTHEYPIDLTISPYVQSIRCILEHPFWNMKPEIEYGSIDANQKDFQILTPGRISMEIDGIKPNATENESFIKITFSGIEKDYLIALQYQTTHDITPVEPPVRYQPPIYPINLENIIITKSQDVISLPGMQTLLYMSEMPWPLQANAILNGNENWDNMTLRVFTVNGYSVYSAPPLMETILDNDGIGRIEIPFNTMRTSNNELYEPTQIRFELLHNDKQIALSDTIEFGQDIYLSTLEIDFYPISSSREWELYK